MKTDYQKSTPRHPRRFEKRQERFKKGVGLWFIPAALAVECEMLLSDYYGGIRRMVLHLARTALNEWLRNIYWGIVFWICDRLWTQLIPFEPGSPWLKRHGRQCSPNCNDMECIEKAVPKWFQRLTGWEEM